MHTVQQAYCGQVVDGADRKGQRVGLRAIVCRSVSGEQLHAQGADGARRAKLWLEATTRANVWWVNPEPVAVPKLSFSWIDGASFSFDLGGTLSGGTIDGQEFLAESKQYANANDQNALYDEYLAKCYVALKARPDRCDNFMWITWSAFATTTWSELCTAGRVEAAVKKHAPKALGVAVDNAAEQLDVDHCGDVAGRLWIIVLSERQEEHLVLAPEHQALIRAHVAQKAAAK